MSAQPYPAGRETLDTIAGLMSAAAIFVALLSMVNVNLSLAGTDVVARPGRAGVAAIALALVSSAIGGRHRRLAAAAVGVTGLAWLVGMIIAVVTEHPLF